jgi:FG-GAP repeat
MKRVAVLMVVALAALPLATAEAGRTSLSKREAFRRLTASMGARSGGSLAGGSSTQAVGDFDDDGRADLAIGLSGKDVGGFNGAGAVEILYGGPNGVTPGPVLLTEALVTGADGPEGFEQFGASLAGGDFNGDGISDLAVGMPGESSAGVSSDGAVAIFMGTPGGITAASTTQLLNQTGGTSFFEGAETGDRFGSVLATGKFDTGPTFDLAIGVPNETHCDICSPENVVFSAGAVGVIYGSPTGLDPATSTSLSQGGLVNGAPEANDGFGATLAAGDLGRNKQWDLAIGSAEDVGEMQDAGAVNVIYGVNQTLFGSPLNGLVPLGDQMWTQDSDGVKDQAEGIDNFGSFGLAVGNVVGSRHADLIVGAAAEGFKSLDLQGAVHVLRGGSQGVTATGNKMYNQETPGVPDSSEIFDLWGYRIAVGDVNGDGRGDLIVAAPGESFGTGALMKQQAGAVWVLRSTSSGPTGTGSKMFTQNTPGIPESTDSNDNFGIVLTSGNYAKSAAWEVVIGVPAETLNDAAVDPLSATGVVHLLFGSANGTTTTGNRMLSGLTPGMPSPAEDSDSFGSAAN